MLAFSSSLLPTWKRGWYTHTIGTILSYLEPFRKGVLGATSVWPLLFLVGVVTAWHASGLSAARFVGNDGAAPFTFARGGPIVTAEDEAVAVLGAVVAPGGTAGAGTNLFLVGGGAVLAPADPLTNLVPLSGGLTKYRVRAGDTLSSIAAQFGISVETVRWANPDLKWSLRVGQEITVLPVSGVVYNVREGDSLESVAGRFQVDSEPLKQYNPDYQKTFAEGAGALIVPNARPLKGAAAFSTAELPDLKGYFTLPARGWNWGELHERNAVDIANTCGTPVFAAAEGVVIPDDRLGDGKTGWNEGYGTFVLVEHPNGTKTRYAHLETAAVALGDYVNQGDQVGTIGNTGNTHGPTGCHVHFEVHGAKNPFAVR